MIDWLLVARSALWIGGLSLALAAWSWARWLAGRRRVRLRQVLGWPVFLAPWAAGMALFAAGLAWGAHRPWERALWIALGLAFLWQVVSAWRAAADGGWSGGGQQAS